MIKLPLIRGAEDPNSFFVTSDYGELLFDSGASSSQLRYSERTAELAKLASVESHGAMGSKQQETAVVNQLCIGGLTAHDLTVTLDDTHGILGNDVLGDLAYTFDVQQLEVTFIEPFSDGIPCRIGQRRHFYLPIQICGKDYTALLDTGASASLIDLNFYHRQFGETSPAATEMGKDFTGATMETQIVSVDSLQIGGVRFPAHEFAALNFSQIFPAMEYPIVAIIGATTLSVMKFSINQKDGYIRVEPYK